MPDEAHQPPIPEAVPVPDGAPPFDDAIRAEGVTPSEIQDLYPESVVLPGSPAGLADLGPWPSQFALALAEALGGARPAGQLLPWTTVAARRRISQLSPLLATERRPQLRRLIVNSPAVDVLELSLVVGYGDRIRAVAIRLERGRPGDTSPPGYASPGAAGAPRPAPPGRPRPADRWYCTAIEAA